VDPGVVDRGPRAFHPDHRGAEIGQQHRRIRRGPEPSQLNHPNPRQGIRRDRLCGRWAGLTGRSWSLECICCTRSSKIFIKESVNQSVDAMGFTSALNACFTIHQLNHALVGGVGREDRDRHCRVRYGRLAGGAAAAAAGVPVRGVIR
jgi:hypothetical protein